MAKWCGQCQVVVLTLFTLIVATWMMPCEGETDSLQSIVLVVVVITKQVSLNSFAQVHLCVFTSAGISR